MKRKKRECPILDRLIAEGIIFIEHDTYYGRRKEEPYIVMFGMGAEIVEGYLEAHPTPEEW